MRMNQVLMTLFASSVMLFSSCTKEEVADDTQTGNIKVSITYIPPSSSSYVYFLSEAFTIRLKKNGSTVATQTYSGGTHDLGEYEYGTYTVEVTGKEGRTSLTTGSTINNYDTFYSSRTVVLDAPTVTTNASF